MDMWSITTRLLGMAPAYPDHPQRDAQRTKTRAAVLQHRALARAGDQRDLDAVDQAGGHQRPVHRQAAV
jgi:hypothetical protein